MKPKKLIDEFFNRAERIVNEYFDFRPTGSSGQTRYDKLDGKGEFYRVEVKATHKPSKSVNFEEFRKWELMSAKDRKQMFEVIMFADENDGLDIANSVVVVNTRFFKSLLEFAELHARRAGDK